MHPIRDWGRASTRASRSSPRRRSHLVARAGPVLLTWALCGSGCPQDLREANLEACAAFLELTRCGDADFTDEVDCAAYDDAGYARCDVTQYFVCLIEQSRCVDGVLDATGWTECAERAACD